MKAFSGSAPLELYMHGYIGDGVVDIADATRSDTMVDMVFWSSKPNGLLFDLTPYVNSLVSQGQQFMGLNLRVKEAYQNSFLDLGASEYAQDPPVLTITYDANAAAVAPHDWYMMRVLADGDVTDTPTDGVFDSVVTLGPSITAGSTWIDYLSRYTTQRALLEFDTSILASKADISRAALKLSPSAMSKSGAPAVFELYSYAGDGMITLADADAPATLIDSVSLDNMVDFEFDVTDYFRSLQSTASVLAGLQMRSALDGSTLSHKESITVGSSESTFTYRPYVEVISEK